MKFDEIKKKIKDMENQLTKVMTENFELSQRIKSIEEHNKKMEETWNQMLNKK